jgi:hypothetical protein
MVASLFFRTHMNVELEDGVREECSDNNVDDSASVAHTPSPSLSTSSTAEKKEEVRHLRFM